METPKEAASASRQAPSSTTFRDAAYYVLGTQLPPVVLLALSLVSRRVLTLEEFGVFNLVRLAASYLTYARLGLEEAAEFEIPRAHGACEGAVAQRMIATLFGVTLVEMAVGALLGTVAIPLVVRAGAPGGISLFLPAVVVLQILSTFYWVLYRSGSHFRAFGRTVAALSFVEVAVTVPLVLVFHLAGLFAGFVISQVLRLVVLHVVATKEQFFVARPTLDLALARRLAKVGLPLLANGLVGQFYATVDLAVVARELGPASLGVYSLGAGFGGRFGELLNGIAVTYKPRFMRSVGRSGSIAVALVETERDLTRALALVYPASAIVAVAGLSWLVRHVLPQYEPHLGTVRVLLLVATFCPVLSFPTYPLVAAGRLGSSMAVYAVVGLLGGATAWFFARSGYGMVPVALTMGVMHYTSFLVFSLLARRVAREPLPLLVLPGMGTLAPIAALMAYAVERLVAPAPGIVLDAGVAASKVLLFALAWLVVLALVLGPGGIRRLLPGRRASPGVVNT